MLTTIKGKIDSNTIAVDKFNTPLSSVDRSSRQKINKETKALKGTLVPVDLTDIYTAFHPKQVEYTLSKIDHKLGHKTDLRIFIILSIFSDYITMRLEINKTQTHGG